MKLKLLSIIIFISCISLFLSLGFWQLDRAKEKDNIVNLYKNRQQAKIEKLTTISDNNISNLHYRNFVIKGNYINKVFLVDNKIKNKKPGFNVISPFKLLSTSDVILVDRGWIELRGERQDIVKNFNYLNTEGIEKNVQEINGYIYPRVKSYTIGDIFIDDKWPRLIQAINFDEISKELSDLGLLKFVSNKDEISSMIENIEAISDSLKKDINLWLNENRGASKFISKKVCKEFNLI